MDAIQVALGPYEQPCILVTVCAACLNGLERPDEHLRWSTYGSLMRLVPRTPVTELAVTVLKSHSNISGDFPIYETEYPIQMVWPVYV